MEHIKITDNTDPENRLLQAIDRSMDLDCTVRVDLTAEEAREEHHLMLDTDGSAETQDGHGRDYVDMWGTCEATGGHCRSVGNAA